MAVGGTMVFTLLALFARQHNDALTALRGEQARAESLLLNILPRSIADKLKVDRHTIADQFTSASILFADVVDCNPKSEHLAPAEVVDLLDHLFSHFDDLADRFGLEKIKTIGDCYMVAAGVPTPLPDHARAIVLMALEMVEAMRSSDDVGPLGLELRIGVDSGPVFAGVIGRKRFLYDLWGDAVNTASRMESQGTPGRIQITRATLELLGDDFVCEPRGDRGQGQGRDGGLARARPARSTDRGSCRGGECHRLTGDARPGAASQHIVAAFHIASGRLVSGRRRERRPTMRVLVAGANGAVGKRLVPMLLARGHEVIGTGTNERSVAAIRVVGADAVVMDGLDGVAVGETVAKATPDAIIHQMTALSGTPDFRHFDRWFGPTNRLRTEGTEHLLAAARASGVRRFIAQGFTGWSNSRTGSWVKTEDDPLDPTPVPQQAETLAALKFLERVVTEAPLDGIVVRYGGLYGPGASQGLEKILRKRMFPIVGSGAGIVSSLHVDDAAAATVAALERGRPGVYNIVDDDPAPTREFMPAIADALAAKPPLRIPAWLGRLFAGEVAVTMMTEGRGSSNAKAKRELGWQPIWPSWRDGYRYGLDTPVPVVPASIRSASPGSEETTAA